MSSLENVKSLKKKQLMLDLLTASQLSKSIDAFSNQLDPQNVVMFFKCMETSCDFCTEDEDSFRNHLLDHISAEDYHCCYCDTVASTLEELVSHMVAVHGSCKFQCAMCFYRSRTLTHIRVHALLKHSSRTGLWYMCREKVAPDTKLVCYKKDHIQNYACIGECNFKALCPELFFQHLSTAHQGLCQFSCYICSKEMNCPDDVIKHYTEMHGFYAFHCIYCPFGSNRDWDVIVHVSNSHSDKPFLIFCRGEELPKYFIKLKELEKPNLSTSVAPRLSAGHEPKNELGEHSVHGNSQAKLEIEMPAKDCVPMQDDKESSLTSGSELSKFRCKCGAVFGDVEIFWQHIAGEHSQDSGFDCPRCVQFTNGSMSDLFLHIVDCHTVSFRCMHKSFLFFGTSQASIDRHIMHVHLRYEENASAVDPKGACSAVGAVAAELDKQCLDDTLQDVTNTATTGEPPFEEDMLQRGANAMHICSQCNRAYMQPLDYFRHMSLGHGINYFCGHCEKRYKQKKRMILHHGRCHASLQLLVKSFENNEVKDITQQIQLDLEKEMHNKDGISSVDIATTSAIKAIDAAESSDHGSASKPVARFEFSGRISSMSTVLHYTRSKKNSLLVPSAKGDDWDIHCKERSSLKKFGNLEPFPLRKKPVTDKQKKHKNLPGSLEKTKKALNPCTKQQDQANRQRAVNVQRAYGNKSNGEMVDGKTSLQSGRTSCHVRPLTEDKAQQPVKDSKPVYYCGHCFKAYRLLQALKKHQETIHPELPVAKRLDMSKLDGVTNDVMAKNSKYLHVTKSGSFVSAKEDEANGSNEKIDCSEAHTSSFSDASVGSCSDVGTALKRGWRRIRVLDCKSEDEGHTSSPDQEGFSYYVKPVEPLDYSNLYICFQNGNVRLAYQQFQTFAKINPIVLVRNENLHELQMRPKWLLPS